jgi:signal transduction histidine kinase
VLGKIRFFEGNYLLALSELEKGLGFAQQSGQPEALAHLHNSRAVILIQRGDYEQALQALSAASEIWERLGRADAQVALLTNIGWIQLKMKQYEQSIYTSERVIELSTRLGIPVGRMSALNHIGLAHEELGDLDKALDYHEQSLAYAREINAPQMLLAVLTNAYMLSGRLQRPEAASYYAEAEAEASRTGNLPALQRLYKVRGQLAGERGSYAEALSFYTRSLALAREQNSPQALQELYPLLAETEARLGNAADAYGYMQQLDSIRVHLAEATNSQLLAELAIKFELDAKEKQIQALERARLVGRYQTYGALGLGACLLTLLLALLSHMRTRRRAARALQQQLALIREKNQQLEAQQREIDERNSLLQEINQDLKMFAGKISHEIRTPLRQMVSFLQLYERRSASPAEDSARELVREAIQIGLRAEALATRLLHYAQVGHKQLPFTDVRLDALFETLRGNLSLEIEIQRGELRVAPGLPIVHGVQEELLLLFQNLVHNALKYHQPNHAPIVEVNFYPLGQSHYVITVRDNGIGIAREDWDKVFQVFERVHGDQKTYSGSGLGLALCRKIAEMHHGRIWLESEPERGACFYVQLPAGSYALGSAIKENAHRRAAV